MKAKSRSASVCDEIYQKAELYLDTRQNHVHIAISYDFARRLLVHYPELDSDKYSSQF